MAKLPSFFVKTVRQVGAKLITFLQTLPRKIPTNYRPFLPIHFWWYLPSKFLWNSREIHQLFLQICFWKSREIRLFSRNLSEALHKTLMNDKSRGKQVDMSTSWNKALHSPKMKSIVFSQNKNTLCFNQSYNAIQQYFACMLFHKFVGKLWKYNCLNFKVWDGISVTM